MAFKSPWRGVQAFRRRMDNIIGSSLAATWSPALPTSDGGVLPEHWYRSDGPLWQDAGVTPAVSDGDVVGRWDDLTANADHVRQANAGNKPTRQSGAGDLLNGYPVIRADGIDDYLQGAFTTGGAMPQPNTVFVVAKATLLVGVNRSLVDGDDGANRHLFRYRVADTFWDILAGVALVGGAGDLVWNIWTAVFNGATSRFWHNGVAECAAGNAGAQGLDGLTFFTDSNGNNPFKGDACEAILYDANLSDADKNQVGQYLATRYGLAYTDI